MARIKIKDFIEKNYIYIITSVIIFLLGFFVGRIYPDILNQAVVSTKEYSSLIVAIATVFLVIATVFLVRATVLLVRVTLTQNKPWLYFFKKEDRPGTEFNKNGNGVTRLPQLYVKNVGKGPAIEIEFKIEQNTIQLNALSPQEEVNIIKIYPSISDKLSKKNKITDIKYNDLNNQSCSQDNVILQT